MYKVVIVSNPEKEEIDCRVRVFGEVCGEVWSLVVFRGQMGRIR